MKFGSKGEAEVLREDSDPERLAPSVFIELLWMPIDHEAYVV
jgi:hypothetical protein